MPHTTSSSCSLTPLQSSLHVIAILMVVLKNRCLKSRKRVVAHFSPLPIHFTRIDDFVEFYQHHSHTVSSHVRFDIGQDNIPTGMTFLAKSSSMLVVTILGGKCSCLGASKMEVPTINSALSIHHFRVIHMHYKDKTHGVWQGNDCCTLLAGASVTHLDLLASEILRWDLFDENADHHLFNSALKLSHHL